MDRSSRSASLESRTFVRLLAVGVAAAVLAVAAYWMAPAAPAYAQKAQSDFGDKLHWGTPTGGVAVACSADGKYVYVAGPDGVLVSENFGKTGTWSLVVRGK